MKIQNSTQDVETQNQYQKIPEQGSKSFGKS